MRINNKIFFSAFKSILGLITALPFILFSITGFANGFPTASPESVGLSSGRLERLTDAMQRYIDKDQLAGTVSLIARNGKVVHVESQGWKNKETGEVMTDDSIFVIMSMTKPIVSAALMMLYEEGHFLLTDPITDWIPELEGKEVIVNDEYGSHRVPAEGPINIRHVLSHTAGVDPIRAALTAEELELLPRAATLEQTLIRRAPLPLSFEPGSDWQYGSSTDYVALLVERISGTSLVDYLQQNIFDPLQMVDTHYIVPKDKVDRVAAVYSPTGPNQSIDLFRAPEYQETTYFGGVAGLSSTVSDYWRFSQMLLNGGELDGVRLLSPKTINLMISNHSGDNDVYIRGPGYTFGLGFGIVNDPGTARDPLTPGTFSWGGAWGTIFFVDPVENLIGIMMTQITSYSHLTVRQDVGVTAMQSIIDSYSNKPYAVKPYQRID
ncbi:MAG TPA: class A beta-lactamase-related serine hydrolase [Porticoccaceae bacterium]|jgi:CubicO group peptidase (beta-lactamase class C family)|nr:class A beta-lactamase-related serine hydrolase [Gammaproteobacteria bacterium]HIL59266.1 class A beta-lactamase-related serine hydrolase [Porticoccaceae bacterium]